MGDQRVNRGESRDGEEEVLTVEFLGEVHEVPAGEDLRFGRNADLTIDANPFMHRVVGRFVYREGVWWLQNHGTKTAVELTDRASGATLQALPGQQVPVLGNAFILRFTAGPTNYELTGTRSGGTLTIDEDGDVLGTETIDFGAVPLSPEQHLLLVAMYESGLRAGRIESSAVIAEHLGWSIRKFNRKLDAVCDKVARLGVPGIRGRSGQMADRRREALVSYALTAGLVGPNDLALLRALEANAEPNPRAS